MRRKLIAAWLTAVAMSAATPAAAEWMQATSEHFIVYGDMNRPQIEAFAAKLERFDALLRASTGLKLSETANPLTVYAVRNVAAVQRSLGRDGTNVAGAYVPNISGSIAIVPEAAGSGGRFDMKPQTVLFHEYAHHFMLQYFPTAYPAWYVEGFAEYWSTTRFAEDGAISIGYPAQHRYYGLALFAPFPLARMFSADVGRMSDDQTESFYSWSWLLTHYLSIQPERKGQLTKYLKLFAAGTAPPDAARQAFGDIAVLDKDLAKYLKAPRLSYYSQPGLTFAAPAIAVQPLGANIDPLMALTVRFAKGSNGPDQVAAFAADARKLASRYPSDPRMLEMLAEGELDADKFDAATAANDALLPLRPADARAMLRRARIAAARLGNSTDPVAWKAVRVLVARANRAAPDDPFPLVEYYRSFAVPGITPPKLAIDGLTRALELAPQVSATRFALGTELMKRGDTARAALVVTPLLNDPHSANVRDAARALLAGNTRGADKAAKAN